MSSLNQILLAVIEIIIIIALPVLAVVLVQYLRGLTTRQAAQSNDEQQSSIQGAVKIAVAAAEQIGSLQNLLGSEKKAHAIQVAQSFLEKRGINVDLESLSNLIEAQVHQQGLGGDTPSEEAAANRQVLIQNAVETAVMSAEQSGLKGFIQNIGTEKKSYAIDMAIRFLSANGLDIDPQILDGLIEAQLMKLFLAARGQLPTS